MRSAVRFPARVVLSLLGFLALAPRLSAQTVDLPPSNVVLPNYDSLPIGQTGGLQAGAYVARAKDDTSNWYNPAGLSRSDTSSISTSAGTYQLLSLDIEALPEKGTGTQQVPALLGILVKKPWGDERWNAGILLVRTNSWLQETDAELNRLVGNTGDLLTYSSDSYFQRVEGSLGLSYSDGGPWRFGAALSGVYTYLRTVQSTSESVVADTGLSAAQSAGRQTGSLGQGRVAVGVQYDLSPEIQLGALVRTPGFTVVRNGTYTVDAIATLPEATATLSFFDQDIRFNYKLPFEVVAGGAYVRDRFELELDVKFYTGNSAYNLFETQKQATLINTGTPGTPPIVTLVPVSNIVTDARAIVNVAVGGHFTLTQNKAWKLHFGFNTDMSPLGDEDQFFAPVDLYSFRVGVSGETQHFVGSLGIQYAFGSATVPFERIAEQTTSEVNVHSLGFLYSLGYRF
jgi:hypothetical protein